MTKTQKEVLQVSLDDEKAVIRKLKQVYKQAAKDCEAKIAALNARTDLQNLQTIIYQRQYQEALKGQLDAVLSTLQSNEYSTVSEYLSGCYETGYIGTMYDLAEQGIPIVSPIDQAQAAAAIQTDTQLKTNLYESMGEDVDKLKSSISSELSRGIANGSSWLEVAAQVASGMNSPFNKALNRTTLIARTEGHRIQNQAALNAAETARDNGADVVKQWDATLDDRTRPDHRAADGQIRELNEEFDVGGEKMTAPGIGGSAKQVCNCRCALLQRARWALDEDELDRLKARAEYYGLTDTKDFGEFKDKYLDAVAIEAESGIIRLSGSEMYAVNQYMGFQSYVINEKLRTSGEAALSDSEKKLVADLDSALEKFPTYSGAVTRSLQFGDSTAVEQLVSQFETGKAYSTPQYLSTTKSDELYNPDGEVQIYIVNSKSGRDVSSVNTQEAEVLFNRSTEFITIDKSQKDGTWYIILEEQDDE